MAQQRWVARLVAGPGTSVDRLLELPLGLDVWEHHGDELVVAADAEQLAEIERRGLATIERLSSVEDFVKQRTSRSAEHEEER